MRIINGVRLAENIMGKLQDEISYSKLTPRLDIVFVGNDFASNVYVDKKVAQAKMVGIETRVHRYDTIAETRLTELINNLNEDQRVDGILIQLPIKAEVNTKRVLQHIDFFKDVDGLNPISLGYLWQFQDIGFAPATALAVLECLKFVAVYEDHEYNSTELKPSEVEKELKDFLKGKNITVINHSNIVGKPTAALLLKYGATVTIAHKDTKDLQKLTKASEIIISGTGVPGIINKDMISENSTLIDIGINNTAKGIGGDVDYKGAEKKIDWLTPVPGGVGPLTIAMLLKNVVIAHKNRQGG